jgi:murein DD-endopeptidase MepM/ murein hydrolase activator NlpD
MAAWQAHGTLLVLDPGRLTQFLSDAEATKLLATSGAEALLEAPRTTGERLSRLRRVTGAVGRPTPHLGVIANEIAEVLMPAALQFPLPLSPLLTRDPMSFQWHDFSRVTEIPMAGHPGSFGAARRFHRHEGVDLYALPGTKVHAMEAGIIVGIHDFTGPAAGSPWWLPTSCVMIEGASGVINYGDITPASGLQPGRLVEAGDTLGTVATVLREDEGRPRSMLHIERYVLGTSEPIATWALGSDRPRQLLDPTGLLLRAARAAPAVYGMPD